MFAVGSPGDHKSIMNGSSRRLNIFAAILETPAIEKIIHQAMTGSAGGSVGAATTFSRT